MGGGTGALVEGLIAAANPWRYYLDNPGALGSGTYAESYDVRTLGLAATVVISKLSGRQDFPAAAGESALIRLYRYRKTSPTGAFTYTQVTSGFTVDSSYPWSWTQDESSKITGGFEFDPVTDSIAVSNVYVAGGAPTMRALRVDYTMAPAS